LTFIIDAKDKRKEILPETNTNEINYLVVSKDKIAENGEYNLTGDRYHETERRKKQKWPMVRLGEIFEITSSKRVFESEWKNESVPFYRAREIVKLAKDGFVENELFISEEMFEKYSLKYGIPQEGDMMVTGVGTLGVCYVVKKGDRFYFKDGNIIWFKKKTDNITNFVKYVFQTDFIKRQIQQTVGVTVGTYTIVNAKKTQIPLPPIEFQREIVAEIEGYQKIIYGARQVVDNWKPHIDIDPDWPLVKLGDVFKLTSGRFLPQKEQEIGDYNVYGGNGVTGKHNDFFIDKQTLIIGRVGENCGVVHITEPKSWVTDNALLVNEYLITIEPYYLLQILKHINLNNYAKRGGQPSISQTTIYELSIPLPSLETKRVIVAKIEAEQKAVDGCQELIVLYEGKIKTVIERVWGKDCDER